MNNISLLTLLTVFVPLFLALVCYGIIAFIFGGDF